MSLGAYPESRRQLLTSYEQLRALSPCGQGWREFLRYMGGDATVKRMGWFSIAWILANSWDHMCWVSANKRYDYQLRLEVEEAWIAIRFGSMTVEDKVKFINDRLRIYPTVIFAPFVANVLAGMHPK